MNESSLPGLEKETGMADSDSIGVRHLATGKGEGGAAEMRTSLKAAFQRG